MMQPAAILGAYLTGSIPTAYLLVRMTRGIDVRQYGSGNPGATNVARVCGVRLGVVTGAIDAAKGFIAVAIMPSSAGEEIGWWRAAAALGAIAGHNWPIWLKFRGGRGVLTSAGALFHLAWGPVAGALAVFAAVFGVTKYVSVASMTAGAVLVPLVWLLPGPWQTTSVKATTIVAACLILLRHRENLRRLLSGRELKAGDGRRRR